MKQNNPAQTSFDRRSHWENIYRTRNLNEVSWYQPVPEISIDFIDFYHLPLGASIMDAGGGHSLLIDHLLKRGFRDVSVLDISKEALDRTRTRLGTQAQDVTWIEADVVEFKSDKRYDLWHDRAAFHFLTDPEDIRSYLDTLDRHVKPDGKVVIGTFSDTGPTKCSGIEIKQYSEKSLREQLKPVFSVDRCIRHRHQTPSGKIQDFIFCSFSRQSSS